MGITFAVSDNPSDPVTPPSTWTFAQLGDARGVLTEDSATQLDMTVQGSNDEDNKDIAYQTVASGDIQIVARIPDQSGWTGHTENFTGFGVGIAEGIVADSWMAQCWKPFTGTQIMAKHGTDAVMNGGITGAPQITTPRYVAVTYDFSATKIQFWESSDNSDWFQVGSDVIRDLSYTAYAYVFGTSHDVTLSTTAVMTACVFSDTITISEATPPDPATRNIGYIMDGSLATFNPPGDSDHGMRLANMVRADETTDAVFLTGGGHGGVSQDCDSRMAVAGYTTPQNANGAGDTVSPRLNTYFLENRLNWKKDYSEMNGAAPGTTAKDKPRLWNYPFNPEDVGHPEAMPVRYDKTFWFGMSIYVPSNWEHETFHIGNFDLTDWSLCPFSADTASTDWLGLALWNPTAGATHWGIKWGFNDTGYRTGTPYNKIALTDLADDSDYGKWTDFVIKQRLNPFTETTDAGQFDGCRNETYDGNRGILEIWKTFGPDNYDGNGNREFKKIFSRVNQPFGNVPRAGYAPRATPRVYRSWNPSGSRDPRPRSGIFGGTGADDAYLFLGFDCIYVGDEELHGTGFADVNPGQLPEPA
jgi:hypothetical protein